MLFNSLHYIFLFLPIVAIVYFWLNNRRLTRLADYWLVAASLFFYSYWNPKYLPLLLGSITINYCIGALLRKSAKKPVLLLGLGINLGLLGYFKYANFIINNINTAAGLSINIDPVELPLAISFFTFLQIAYLVDCFQQKVKKSDFLHYGLFVTFFPHLIAGPLVHHKDLTPQFSVLRNRFVNWKNVYIGMGVFFIGLFKKVFIADSFSVWAKNGFDSNSVLSFYDAWTCSLSYTMQLYYDFSGYGDMAVGASLIFNIVLPWNFNSPYKATSIQDFWRRWHITLSSWLREYLYIPLGGNKNGAISTYINLFLTFLLGGLWHGANWTFVIWGALHGVAIAIHRLWSSAGLKMPRILGWFVTFLFVNMAWVFFRAKSLTDVSRVLSGMVDIQSAHLDQLFSIGAVQIFISKILSIGPTLFLFTFLPLAFFAKNTITISEEISHRKISRYFIFLIVIAIISLYQLIYMSSKISEFIYFHF